MITQRRSLATLYLTLVLGAGGCESPSDPIPDPGPPVPVIDVITPDHQVAGDPDARLTVRGTGFRAESVVRWNGQALSTVSRVSTPFGTITASVPLSELDEPKEVSITVYTPTREGQGVGSVARPYRVEYPVPFSCGGIDPYFAEVGAPATTFLCSGAGGFQPVTEVYLDAAVLESEYLDFYTLRFTVPAALLADPGTRRIRVRNPGREGPGWSEGRALRVLHPVEVGSGGRQIGAGCILDAYGLLQCWDSIPRPVTPHLRFRELRSSSYGGNSCAVSVSGEVYCWGYNGRGQLGIGTFSEMESIPAPTLPVAGEPGLRELTLGDGFACGLGPEGAAWCWGSNEYGQLGTVEELDPCSWDVPCAPEPVPVAGDLRFVGIAAGWSHTCAVETTGVAYCWGNDEGGQLGNGPGRNDSRVPQPIDSEVRFASITARSTTTCALTVEGAAYCWGGGDFYNLPLSNVPTRVAHGLRFKELTDGRCGLTIEGDIYCFFPGHESWEPVVRHGAGYTWTEIRVGAPYDFSICGFTADNGFLCWGGYYYYDAIEFPLVHGPAWCYERPHFAVPCGYPSPTPVFGVAGQASWPLD